MATLSLCDVCGKKVYGLTGICRCDWRDGEAGGRPKPATPEAPEWKGEVLIRKVTDLDWSDARDMIQVTLDKAAVGMWYGTPGATDGNDLDRALSTPLPHDPPMSVRLMPWKGKADD